MSSIAFQGYELSKHLTLGVGIGIGIGIVLRKCLHEKNEQRMRWYNSLQNLIEEVRELRESLVLLKEAKSHDAVDGKRQGSPESDEEDYFEMAPLETEEEFICCKPEDLKSQQKSAPLKPGNSSLEDIFVKVDTLLDGNELEKEEAYKLLEEQVKLFPRNPELLWRFARAQSNLATLRGSRGDAASKRDFIEKGVKTAKSSIEINGNSASAHKWYAILQGMNIEYLATEEKIKMGYVYKEHIDKAIELDPSDPSAYSLLGRWCFEVYMMPWYLRRVASTLFGEPPSSTLQEALQNFLKAEEIQPGFWKMNSLYIGKCYYQNSEYSKAKEWLLKAKSLPSEDPEDNEVQIEINSLLGKV